MNIVVLDSNTLAGQSLAAIEKLGVVTCFPLTQSSEVIERAKNADVIITNKVQLTEDHLKQLPSLKLICVAATGTNNIDLEAAKSLNIPVTNVAGYSTPSVALHTITLIGNLLTNIHRYQSDCKSGAWQESSMFCRLDYSIADLNNKNLVIFGYGTLGQAVANAAKAFGANIIIAERPNATSIRSGRMGFDLAIQKADILSLHCPLTPDTLNLVNQDVFAALPNHALVINTARGGIVNEKELADALSQGEIAGAALDVLSQEPPAKDNPILNYTGENLLITPHIAWASQDSIARLIKQIANNIEQFSAGTPVNLVV